MPFGKAHSSEHSFESRWVMQGAIPAARLKHAGDYFKPKVQKTIVIQTILNWVDQCSIWSSFTGPEWCLHNIINISGWFCAHSRTLKRSINAILGMLNQKYATPSSYFPGSKPQCTALQPKAIILHTFVIITLNKTCLNKCALVYAVSKRSAGICCSKWSTLSKRQMITTGLDCFSHHRETYPDYVIGTTSNTWSENQAGCRAQVAGK